MVRPKLILICQTFGEFVTGDDGTLSYNGGEAHAVDITPETLYSDLKLKLAETCNFDYDSLSTKYFLPGNRKTLITMSNDRDLKRMYEFHGSSITVEVFVNGKPGFKASNSPLVRATGLKRAAAVTPISAVAATSPPTSLLDSAEPTCGDANDSPTIDMDATPAETVKKRRRVASKKKEAELPDVGKKPKMASRRRKTTAKRIMVSEGEGDTDEDSIDDYNVELEPNDGLVALATSNDIPPEQLVAQWKDGITGPDQEFKSVHEFRDALQKYAVANRFMYRLKKNDTNRASGKCVTEGCSWKLYASWDQSTQTFKIRSMNKNHTCDGESWKSAHPAKNWVVNVIKDRLQESPHHKPKELAKTILRDFGVELNYTQVWRGITDARTQLQGSYKESYNQLPWLSENLEKANPGSLIKLIVNDEKRFHRLYVSFQAMIHGFQVGCRPIIFLDSASLKSKYHEVLLTATTLDGDNGLFPVAFAIVDNENDVDWRWFLEQLKSALSSSTPITFVSDRERGLKNSILEVFENAHYGYSLFHLCDNLKRNSKGPFYGDGKSSLRINLLAAAQALRPDYFKMHTEQIKRVCPQAYDWLMQVEPEHWASSSFKGEPYSHVTSNVADLYTNWIDEVRESPISQKIEALRSNTSGLILSRRTASEAWVSRLTPTNEDKVRDQRNKAHGLKVLFSSDTLFEVQGDSTHVVDINKQSCTCLVWKSTEMPCSHAIAVFSCTSRNMYDYCSKYFTVDTYRSVYSKSINPVLESFKALKTGGETDDEETEIVLPPIVARPPPQPKIKESGREEQEQDEQQIVVKKTRRIVTCAKCKETGHNKATCKAD